MDIEKIISQMTFEEKASFLSGAATMSSCAIDRLGVKAVQFADGPHGVRIEKEKNCTHFPNLCNLGSSWDVDAAYEMGQALASDCIHNGIELLLGPGINIKRHILCGRNFEYLSEDPVLAGELAAGYINGLQEKGVSASLKHFALNSQEKYREEASAEIDERTMREIYLKGFEIAVKKSKPHSVMCAYNKINGIWCSENEYLLKTILKQEWGFDGMVVSDWGAVHDISRCVKAGLDLQMPDNKQIVKQLQKGVKDGLVTMDDIDDAVRRMLKFADRAPVKQEEYDRDKQHSIARKIAADGMVMLKNDNDTLPLTSKKYKKIAVVGEFAKSPLIAGQGSAEVLQWDEYIDSPLEELKKLMPKTEFKYIEPYQKRAFSDCMLWPKHGAFAKEIGDSDLVLMFVGSMESEDTENYDRRTAHLNPNYEAFINVALRYDKKVAVVMQNGGALILDKWADRVGAIVEMWLGGEASGGAVADILCGVVNPSGKLSETFPKVMRADLNYPGDGLKLEYSERFDVGYRYYDKHPEEIAFPFGHGLSYTKFEYSDLQAKMKKDTVKVSFTLTNVGKCDGAEVVQLYVGDPVSTVVKPIKELKKFKKVYLKAGKKQKIEFTLTADDLSYYNPMLRKWVVESGVYDIYIGASSQDIRLKASVMYTENSPYTIKMAGEPMIG